ncbi:glycyl-radical enzyme activating protein [candidate division WOR-3 bacterium]|nr:glycyl-radical enzyme activating protein [candidate division WOR-3 bacterium]
MTDEKGLLFDIQGFSVHDGPGCRTLIFLKGCPLHCRWCSNPEGIASHPEIMYYKTECVKDHACVDVCPTGSISFKNKGDFITIDRVKCSECIDFKCVGECNHNALRVSGFYSTVGELVEKIQRDRQYWGSGGGVTLSGGEPMFQPEFTTEILKSCYDSYIHTGLETCGYVSWKYYEKVLNYIDWIFFDIKHMDPEVHKKGTGVSNKLILENAERIASRRNYRMIFRMPIIPKFNDSVENITATAKFIREIGKEEVNILPIHHLGSTKYELLGMKYTYKAVKSPNLERMEKIKNIFETYSIKC